MKTLTQALRTAPWRYLTSRWPWVSLGYAAASAVIGISLFGLFTGSFIFVVTIPILAIALSAVERRRTTWLGRPEQPSAHLRIPQNQNSRWLAIRFKERITWREVGAAFVNMAAGWVMFALLLAQFVALAVAIGLPAEMTRRQLAGSSEPLTIAVWSDSRLELDQPYWWIFLPLAAIVLILGAYLNGLAAALQDTIQRSIYAPRAAELGAELDRVLVSRDALVKAQEGERRRIERDLHDGVQQDLVILASRLGITELELALLAKDGADVGRAKTALTSAQEAAETALASLRNTVRGIHPAVLTDAGLVPALHELSGRAAVPFTLEVVGVQAPGTPGVRLPSALESALYYAATEALSNAAKHASAQNVRVSLRYLPAAEGAAEDGRGAWVELSVSDDGVGGAHAANGTGLSGLAERAATLGGTLTVISPDGRGTMLSVHLPVENPAQKGSHAHPAG